MNRMWDDDEVLGIIYEFLLPVMAQNDIKDTPAARMAMLKLFIDNLLEEEVIDNYPYILVGISEMTRLRMQIAAMN